MHRLAFRDLRFQRLGAMLANASEPEGTTDQLNFGGFNWIRYGIWDDTIPTSDEWSAAADWLVNGAWVDSAPTGGATWSAPDGTGFTTWTDSEVTI